MTDKQYDIHRVGLLHIMTARQCETYSF